jgi:predicted ATPase
MSAFIRRVTIRNYKSIAACQVELGPLMFLVGPNGAGKSNFLDALRFVADALRTSIDHALRERGTIGEVRRQSGGHPNHFALRFDFTLPSGQAGHYAIRVGAKSGAAFEVQDEECQIFPAGSNEPAHYFRVKSGSLRSSSVVAMPAALSDRLFLVAASGVPEFRPVFDALSRMEVYNLNPNAIAAPQKSDPGDILRRDGGNAASVYQRFTPAARNMVRECLSRIVPAISDAEVKVLGSQEMIEFRQIFKGQAHPSHQFMAAAMSDGTLRAFGLLLAVFQSVSAKDDGNPPLLIGLEEPEIALHPAAASVLLSELRQGAEHSQILVTSHSPELLDNPDIPAGAILAVDNEAGLTRIGRIDQAGLNMLREKLFTPGELLRQNQLFPNPATLMDVADDRELNLFDHGGC